MERGWSLGPWRGSAWALGSIPVTHTLSRIHSVRTPEHHLAARCWPAAGDAVTKWARPRAHGAHSPVGETQQREGPSLVTAGGAQGVGELRQGFLEERCLHGVPEGEEEESGKEARGGKRDQRMQSPS